MLTFWENSPRSYNLDGNLTKKVLITFVNVSIGSVKPNSIYK